jgi:hypothetical protein
MRVRMNFEMRAQALALLDGLDDEKIPSAVEFLRRLSEETPPQNGLEELLEDRA